MMQKYRLIAALAAFLWLTAPLASNAAETTLPVEQEKQQQDDKQEKPIPEAKVWTSRNQIRIGGNTTKPGT